MTAVARFVEVYRGATVALSTLRLSSDELTAHLRELTELAGPDGALEDYADEVFGTEHIRTALARIDAARPAPRLRALVNDLLVAAALVPVRERKVRDVSTSGTTSLYQRRAIEVVSVQHLRQTLTVIANDPATTVADDIGYDEAAALDVRLLRLATLNLSPAMRTTLQHNNSYQRLARSPQLAEALYAATGHDEQRFISTCVVAAQGTELRGRTPTVLGLVEIGRELIRTIKQKIADMDLTLLDERQSGVLRPSRTLGELVFTRLTQAEETFRDIEHQLDGLDPALTGDRLTAVLDRLTRRWSRTMQKLAPLAAIERGTAGVAVLSKKLVDGTWAPNAVLAAPLLADRGERRFAGFGQAYFTAVTAPVPPAATLVPDDGSTPVTDLFESGPERSVVLASCWRVVHDLGGCGLFTGTEDVGHVMWLKAARRDGRRVFLLSDPKVAGFDVLGGEKFVAWAARTRARVVDDVARAILHGCLAEKRDPARPIGGAMVGAADVRVRVTVSW